MLRKCFTSRLLLLRGPFQPIARERVSFVFPFSPFFFLFLFLPLLFTFQRNADGKLISILLARPSRSRNYKETLVTRAIRRKREDGTWKEGERKNPPSLAMDFIVEHRRNDFNVARHVSADILTVS